MKKILGLIAIVLVHISTANAQLPLNFGSTGWKYFMKNSTPIKPQDYVTVSGDVGFPGTYNWTSPNYNTVSGVTWASSATLPIGYGTNWPGYVSGFIWGTNPSVSPIPRTSYYRKTLTGITGYTSITINCKSDDAVAIYLNGTEVHRTSNLPVFPTAILPTDNPSSFINSSSPLSSFQTSVTISGSTLTSILAAHPTSGNLTVTAEVHQNDTGSGEFTTSSDSYFDIEITGDSGPLVSTIVTGPYLQLPLPNGIQVRWKTNISELGKVCFSSSGPITVPNPGTCISESGSATLDHKINITGLVANTKYYYAIENTSNTLFEATSEHYFNTPPTSVDNNKITKIWVTGDLSQDQYTFVQPNVLSAFENFKSSNSIPNIDIWLLLGDIGNEFGTITEYENRFFNIYDASTSNIMKQTPILPSPGNHDYYTGNDIVTSNPALASYLNGINKLQSGDPSDIFSSTISRNDNRYYKNNPYYDVFSMPTNGLGGKYSTETSLSKKAYYSYNQNNIHFVCLDSYGFYSDYLLYGNIPIYPATSSANSQFSWLISDLNTAKADPNIKWTIMFWHHSPYTKSGGHFSDDLQADEFILKGIRENLIKYLDDANYKIDLVLNGHSHSYERSKLLKGHHGLESTFSSSIHNNPNLIAGFNSNANTDGKFNGISSCPYIKSTSNSINEGTVYVLAGSAGQLQETKSNVNFTVGHLALNGAYFRPTAFESVQSKDYATNGHLMVNRTTLSSVETTKGGSFYLEIQSNRLDGKFIDQTGVVSDNFTIFKDVASPTIVNQIHQNELPGQSPDLQKIQTPSWPSVTQFTITNPSGTTTGPFAAGLLNVNTPDIGPVYTIKDQTGCLKQDYRFTFNGSCWGNVNINNTFFPTVTPEILSSSGIITSKSLIKNLANVSFIAKNANNLITIGTPPLFQTELGAIFNATINPSLTCPPGGL